VTWWCVLLVDSIGKQQQSYKRSVSAIPMSATSIAVATRRIAVATIVALVDGSFSRLDNQVAARIGAVVEVERNPAGDSGI
jgi:hypothetical protein